MLYLTEKKFDRCVPKKPPVPLRTDHPVMGIQSGKNFINTNAADVIMGVAKKPKPIYVDKRIGDKHDLETSGLFPKYINKKVVLDLSARDQRFQSPAGGLYEIGTQCIPWTDHEAWAFPLLCGLCGVHI